jgi:hypothetical protein
MRRIVGLLIVGVALAAPAPAAAETFTVTGPTDGTSPCQGAACPSIRSALAAAGQSPGADTILVPADTYQLMGGELTVDSPVTIRGAGARVTTIVGDPQLLDRVFDVGPGVTTTISHLTMTGGTAGSHNDFWGGNLRNNGGTVLLDHVRVTGGSASSGGGVGNVMGTMTIQHSLIDRNQALSGGGDSGGVLNLGTSTTPGVLAVRDSTVAFNTAQLGGGIFSWSADFQPTSNVTTLERVTVAYNTGGTRGVGGIGASYESETFRVRGSIVAHNTVNGSPSNCGGVLPDSDGGNVVSNADCGFASAGDLQSTDPLLSLDTVNAGGATDLLTIGPLSPARDRAGACLGADQRDLPRPQGIACDAGAYELDQAPDTSLAVTPGSPGSAPTFQFASPEPGVRFECRLDGPPGPGGFVPCASPTSYPGLAPGAYTFFVRAIDGGGAADPTPAAESFVIQPPSPEPEIRRTVVVEEASGTVRVKLKGSNRFVPLDAAQGIPVGSTVDTLKGRVTLTAAADNKGNTATADFYAGVFKVGQTKGKQPVTTLKLTERLSCPKRGKATAAAKKKKRRLWGDGKGRFRTDGSYSSATVRGTKWLVEDRCASTLTRVVRGRVAVRDFERKKTVIVRKGKRYVAKVK